MNIIRKARIAADRRSIDAYGRSIELAITGYLMDNGDFPTSINDLTIEYSGDEVVCSRAQINSDSTVYLSGCTVAGKSVDGYTYGSNKSLTYTAYSVGDEVTYNNVDYYVLKDSDITDDTVTLLKKLPLTVSEANLYGGVGTDNNHVNRFASSSDMIGIARDNGYGYGDVIYHSSETCGCVPDGNPNSCIPNMTSCISDYSDSDIKYIVDSWTADKVPNGLQEARLIRRDEIATTIVDYDPCGGCGAVAQGEKVNYEWLYSSQYAYWMMTIVNPSEPNVYAIYSNGIISDGSRMGGSSTGFVVRPVIVVSKFILEN